MFDFIFNFLGVTPIFLLKVVFLSLFFFHVVFSFILLRQTKVMTRVVAAGISPGIFSIALIHFFASIGLFLWVLLFF